jgi:opacity protein-like surface antigen
MSRKDLPGRSWRAGIVVFVVLAFCAALSAQSAPEKRYTFNAGGGVSPLAGSVSNRLNTGWHLTVGGGYNVLKPLSLGLQFTYNGFGVNRALLAEANAPGGDARVWSITAEPRLQLGTVHNISPYVVGGVGYYRRTVDFTQPALLPFTVFDPFFGFLNGIVPANQIISSTTKGGIGGNLGAGFSIGLGERAGGLRFFTEARYHYAATGATPTRMVPVTFGIRF